MQRKFRKPLSVVLAFALVLSLFAAAPMAVYAEDASELVDTINNFDHNGSGTLNATLSGNTVTVTGSVTGAKEELLLDIDAGVKVLWQASYSGEITGRFNGLVNLTGTGTFEIGNGGSLVNNGAGAAVIATAKDSKVTVSGGTAESRLAGAAINAYGERASVTVTSGTVRTSNGTAIGANGAQSTVVINGGEAIATDGGLAILAQGTNSSVTITGGTVNATNEAGIRSAGSGSSVTMTGGTVNVTSGVGIEAFGNDSVVKINGGTVLAAAGTGLRADGRDSAITISGGTVSATNGVAVEVTGAGAKATVNGGFVFAFGKAVTGEGNVINAANGSTPAIGGSAAVCAWNKPASGTPTYTEGTADDLAISPANATATWGKNGAQNGINYANTGNTGFFQVNGININAATSFIVSFNSNGGSAVASQSVNTGYKAAKPADPIKADSVFAGWFTDAALTTAYNFDAPVTANLTLYAKWAVAGAPSMSNFKRVNTFAAGMFKDVSENAWYGFYQQKVIANAFEFGLMKGNSPTEFNPTGNITIAEAITVAARVHKIYTTGADDFVQAGSPWYKVYTDYAIENGIILTRSFIDYGKTATRAEMAHIFARALPQTEFAAKNTVNSLPDVNSQTAYSDSIMMLYRAGVLAGSDELGTFNPMNNITRAEAAAIISRIILPGDRFSGRTF